MVAEKTTVDSSFSLADWELERAQSHETMKNIADRTLCDLQLRARGGMTALDSLQAIIQAHRVLEEANISASTQALNEVETRWKPVRTEEIDGEAAAWLMAAERAQVAVHRANAARWASVLPQQFPNVRKTFEGLVDITGNVLPQTLRSWHACHDGACNAWQQHSERLQAVQIAENEGTAPPDPLLSEVRYRERVRSEVALRAQVEAALKNCSQGLVVAENDRGTLWQTFTSSYYSACSVAHASAQSNAVGAAALEVGISVSGQSAGYAPNLPWLAGAPALKLPLSASSSEAERQFSSLPRMLNMPSAIGYVLQRLQVAMKAPTGFFGLGGGGWQLGATLILTMHGHLHLFYSESEKADKSESNGEFLCGEELVESAIKASAYVPFASKCVFLQKGKELIIEVAECEDHPANHTGDATNSDASSISSHQVSPKPAAAIVSGSAAGLRKLFGQSPSYPNPIPRRVYARTDSVDEFRALEKHCHNFVRRGLGRRRVQT